MGLFLSFDATIQWQNRKMKSGQAVILSIINICCHVDSFIGCAAGKYVASLYQRLIRRLKFVMI